MIKLFIQISALIIFLVGIIFLILFVYFRHQEEKVHAEWKKKKQQLQSLTGLASIINPRIKKLDEDMEHKLAGIQRKKKAILDFSSLFNILKK